MIFLNVIPAAVALSCFIQIAVCLSRPNIILIVADDLGWNDVSFHGSNQIPTPNIDALAYNGIILNSHYVPALCTPSRASLLTGKYPTSMGMQHLVILAPEPRGLPLEETLMPEHLRRHGYATHAIGKWHLGFYRKEYTPTYRGFDTHFGYWNGYQDYYDHTMVDQTLRGPSQPLKGYDMRRGLKVDYSSEGEYSTDAFTNEAVRLIENHNSSQGPLFLYLAHLSPHSGNPDNPFQAPEEEVAKHSRIRDPERRTYAAMVTKMDEGVGKVMAALRKADLIDNSIVLFISDNGAPTIGIHSNRGSNFPMRGQKEGPWEGGVRGVAALWSPLLRRPRRVSNQLIHISDWLPTLYSAAGLDSRELGDIDGMDMWDVLSQNLDSPRKEIFNNYDEIEGYASLRVGDWKYIEGSDQEGIYDEWYGESGAEEESAHYEERVFLSKTSAAIVNRAPDGAMATSEDILRLRQESVLTCGEAGKPREGNATEIKRRMMKEMENIQRKVGKGMDLVVLQEAKNIMEVDNIFRCEPMRMVCVFNLEADPCERVNLAKIFPDVVEDLRMHLEKLKKTVVPPQNIGGDPFADPALHNGTWTNWRDSDSDATKEFVDSVTTILHERLTDLVLLIINKVIFKIIPATVSSDHFGVLFLRNGKLFFAVAIFFLFALVVMYNILKRLIAFIQSKDSGRINESSAPMSPIETISGRLIKR